MQLHGIKIAYNGKANSVFYPPDWDVDYSVGEMLLDIYEANTDKIEKLIKDNNHRIYSSLGYLTPVEYRKNNLKKLFSLRPKTEYLFFINSSVKERSRFQKRSIISQVERAIEAEELI